MELIILNEGLYQLVPVSTQMMEGITLLDRLLVNCFDLCDLRQTNGYFKRLI